LLAPFTGSTAIRAASVAAAAAAHAPVPGAPHAPVFVRWPRQFPGAPQQPLPPFFVHPQSHPHALAPAIPLQPPQMTMAHRPITTPVTFAGLSVIIILLCLLAFVLFFMCSSSDVFKICGSMQLLSGLCLAIGILCYPAGWGHQEVKAICGPQAGDYRLGNCGVRWAYILAVVAFFDSIILGCLAFTLAGKKVKFNDEPTYMNPSVYKGEVNGGYIGDNHSIGGSRKSLNLQPVMLMPHGPEGDRYSEYSHRTGRSNQSPFRGGPYSPNVQHNFQL